MARWLALALALLVSPALAQSPKVGDPPEASNMRLVGMNDLQARSAYQPTIHRQGDRYIAYIGHHGGTPDVPKPMNRLTGMAEFNGTSILDVTDPANPKYLKHIPGLEGNYEEGGAQMVRVCDGASLPNADKSKTYMLRVFGGKAHEVWDVTTPANPMLLARIGEGIRDTHKNWWECDTGIAYLVSGAPGWRTRRMMQVYDLSNPAQPKFIRDFGLVGQQPGTEGTVPTELHGAISTGPQGNRLYVGYGTNKGGVLQILDREKLLNGPKEVTPDNLRHPVIGEMQMSPLVGAHTTYPIGKVRIPEFAADKFGAERDMVMIVDESLVNECGARRGAADRLVRRCDDREIPDGGVELHAGPGQFLRARRPLRRAFLEREHGAGVPRQARLRDLVQCRRARDRHPQSVPAEGSRLLHPVDHRGDRQALRQGDGKDVCKIAIQSNNVETDDRGYVYVVDRANTGLHILELTGEARGIAGVQMSAVSPRALSEAK